MTDEELILHIRESHPDKFAEVVSRYQNRLFCYVLRYVHDKLKAEDILQESFIKMYININSFDADRSFSAWAYRITHNETINYIKKNSKENTITDDGWFENIADDRIDFAGEYDKKLNGKKVRDAINILPMKYKEVVVLYYFEGQDYDQIAKVLQIPRSTVGVRLRRAKGRLQKQLQEEANYV